MGNQGGGETSQSGNKDQGASQKVEFASQTPDRVVINDKEKGGSEQTGQDETQEQHMGSSSSGTDDGKDDGSEPIAMRRSRIIIRLPDKYVGCVYSGELHSISFALATGEDIDTE